MVKETAITNEFVIELRRVTHSQGWLYIKEIAESMAVMQEQGESWTPEGKERVFQAAIFRKHVRGLWASIEKTANTPIAGNAAERELISALTSQEVIKEGS